MLGFVTVLLLATKPTNVDQAVILAALNFRLAPAEASASKPPRAKSPRELDRDALSVNPAYQATERRDWSKVIHDIEENRSIFGKPSEEETDPPVSDEWEKVGIALAEMKRFAVKKRTFNPPNIRPLTSFYWPANLEFRKPQSGEFQHCSFPPTYSPDGSMSVLCVQSHDYQASVHWFVLRHTSLGSKSVGRSHKFYL
jgi:hypothetical protein